MSVLNRDEFFSQIKAHIGDSTSDESIQFLENISDTYNELENKAKGDGKDWKAEAERIDNEWRAKYRDRFFNPNANDNDNDDDKDSELPKKLTFENLFKEG